MSHFLLFIFRKLLNTFIYSARHDPLLANAHGLFQKSLPTQPTHNVLVLTSTILGLILELAIRHIIGNVVMPLLILETIENQSPNPNKDDNKKSKPKPTITRSLLQTITTFHRKKGLIFLLNGFQYAIYYNVKYFIVTGLLSSPIARFPEPLAHIIASVALAEYHFFRTAGAVLPPAEQMRYVPLDLDFNRWDALLLPTLLYAVAEAIMMYVPGLLLSPLDLDEVLLLPSDLSGITAL
ncbi:Glyoxalase-like domain family protein [Aspergillus niger]|uniref:Glyoxalase-like domain family protein n=2 Tax=Aspergillus niger TaxID=5061 RepID=A0A505IJ57_ASPNG|nr:Glyoxalase-like domain family protein [Aspergillus niger]